MAGLESRALTQNWTMTQTSEGLGCAEAQPYNSGLRVTGRAAGLRDFAAFGQSGDAVGGAEGQSLNGHGGLAAAGGD